MTKKQDPIAAQIAIEGTRDEELELAAETYRRKKRAHEEAKVITAALKTEADEASAALHAIVADRMERGLILRPPDEQYGKVYGYVSRETAYQVDVAETDDPGALDRPRAIKFGTKTMLDVVDEPVTKRKDQD
jgi:hypothetical protein